MPGFNRLDTAHYIMSQGFEVSESFVKVIICFNLLNKVENLQLLEDEIQLIERENKILLLG